MVPFPHLLLLTLTERPDLSPQRGRRRAEFLGEDGARLELEGVSPHRILRVAAQQALRGAGSPLEYGMSIVFRNKIN